jgi:hypothetical protein
MDCAQDTLGPGKWGPRVKGFLPYGVDLGPCDCGSCVTLYAFLVSCRFASSCVVRVFEFLAEDLYLTLDLHAQTLPYCVESDLFI